MRAPHSQSPRLVVALTALLVLAAACGGGDATTEVTSAPSPEATATEDGGEPADDGGASDDVSSTDDAPADLGNLNVAMSVPESVLFLPADLGATLGVFEPCGLTVTTITTNAGTANQTLAAGEADMVLHLGGFAVGGIMQGLPARVVAGQTNPWSQVLVVSDELAAEGISEATDLEQLSGRRLAFGISAFGSGSHLSVLKVAEQLGWTEGEQYELVVLGGVNEITAALEGDVIDAFAWSPEVAYSVQLQGIGHVIPGLVAEAVGPNVFEAFLASQELIDERPEALRAYFECYFAFVDELKADPERARQLAIDEWGKDPEALDLSLAQIVEDWNADGSATEAELQGLADATVFQNEDVDDAPPAEWWLYWQDIR